MFKIQQIINLLCVDSFTNIYLICWLLRNTERIGQSRLTCVCDANYETIGFKPITFLRPAPGRDSFQCNPALAFSKLK